jgi:hypothetical protein
MFVVYTLYHVSKHFWTISVLIFLRCSDDILYCAVSVASEREGKSLMIRSHDYHGFTQSTAWAGNSSWRNYTQAYEVGHGENKSEKKKKIMEIVKTLWLKGRQEW